MKKKLKVMILHNIISPYRSPLFEELSKRYDLTVYFCEENTSDRKWSTKLDKYSFNYKILPHRQIGPFIINPTLKQELKENLFDIYIAFENPENMFSVPEVIKASKKNKKPFIMVNGRKDDDLYYLIKYKESNLIHKKIFYSICKLIYQTYRESVYKKSDSFTSYCNASTNFLISKGIPREKIFSGIQNYPETIIPRPSWKSKPKEFQGKKIILHIGYLTERKGVNHLIEAFNSLNRKDALLLIIGTGDQEDKLKELAKHNPNIKFLGYMDSVGKANYYFISDFFVFPTFDDVWGHVVTESFYNGLPVILTDKAEAKEIIQNGKNGFIIPDKNSEAIANVMKKLLDNPSLLKEMKKNAKNVPKTKTVDVMVTVRKFEGAINYALQNKK